MWLGEVRRFRGFRRFRGVWGIGGFLGGFGGVGFGWVWLGLVGLVGFGWFGMLILKVIADRHGSLLEMLSHLKSMQACSSSLLLKGE